MTTPSALSVHSEYFDAPEFSVDMHIFSKKHDDAPAPEGNDAQTPYSEADDAGFPGGPSPDAPSSSRFQSMPQGADADAAGPIVYPGQSDSDLPSTAADVRRQPSVAIATGIPFKDNNITGGPTQLSPIQQDSVPPNGHPPRSPTANTNGVLPDGRTARPTSPTHRQDGKTRTSVDQGQEDAPVQRSMSTASRKEPKPILRNGSPSQHSRDVSASTTGGAMGATDERYAANPALRDVKRAGSPPPSVSSRRSMRSRIGETGGAFTDGAATTSIAPPPVDPTVLERVASAEQELPPKAKAKISKEEYKHGKRLSTIIKGEAHTEKAALEVAMKELAEIQKMQKAAVKEESKSHTLLSKAITEAHKAEMEFLAARAAHERAQTALHAAEEALERSREHARDTTEMLRETMDEVERIRMHKQADDRERVLKVKDLTGEHKSGLSRLFGS